MNRLIAVVLLGLSLMVSTLMANVAIASQVGIKIGVVDTDRVEKESPAGRQAGQAIEQRSRQIQLDLDRERESLTKLKMAFDKERSNLNKDELEKRNHYLEDKTQRIQLRFQMPQQELDDTRRREFGVVRDKTLRAVNAIAKSEGFSHVLAKNAMLWSDSAHDLTDKVISLVR
jgi:outer membrane protein